MQVNKLDIKTVVDTRAIHTFITSRMVKKYRLQVSKCLSMLKIMNSKAQSVMGMSYNTNICWWMVYSCKYVGDTIKGL